MPSSLSDYASKVLIYHGFDPVCRTASGFFHDVFIADGAVVRIPRNGNNFAGEKWAMERARERGVPVPRVFFVNQEATPPYMILERIDGNCPLHLLSPETYKLMGNILARIHSVPVSGYGILDGNGKTEFSNWEEFIDSRRRGRLEALDKVNSRLAKRSGFIYDELKKHSLKPCLVHGDYQPGNWLFKNGKLTGIIDFMGVSNSPYFDIGELFVRISDDDLKYVEEGYGIEFDKRLIALNAAHRCIGKIQKLIDLIPSRGGILLRTLEEIVNKLEK